MEAEEAFRCPIAVDSEEGPSAEAEEVSTAAVAAVSLQTGATRTGSNSGSVAPILFFPHSSL
jgi:hypothetical protein